MSKNIFLSGIYHETHTFLGEPTTLKDFIIFHDEEIINENTGNGSPTDGFIEYASGQNWNILSNNVFQNLGKPEFNIQLRVFGTGGNWAIDTLDVEFIRGSIADGLEVDIGLDGISDWSMDKSGIGRLGIQDRFSDDSLSKEIESTSSAPASFNVLMPTGGLESFSFFVSSPSKEMISPYMTISIGGQDILTKNLGNINSAQKIILDGAYLKYSKFCE